MDTAQEALFKAMLQHGWFTESDGDVEAPTGYFGYMVNGDMELREIRKAFEDVISAYGDVSDDDLIGYWFAAIDSNGIIHIHRMMSRHNARDEFYLRADEFAEWSAE